MKIPLTLHIYFVSDGRSHHNVSCGYSVTFELQEDTIMDDLQYADLNTIIIIIIIKKYIVLIRPDF
jgi:hypothetical protein